MKKLLILLLFIAVYNTGSFAQMQIGLKLGGNIANLTGDDAGNPDSKVAFAFGGFFAYQLSSLFVVQPEVYYTMKGAKDKLSISGTDIDITITLNYIEIPVLAKLLIPVKGSNINPSIFAGPFVGINTTAKSKAEYSGGSEEADIEDIKSTEFGLQFGGGVGFNMGKNKLGVDIRYILGLTTIDDSAEETDVKNGVINFNLYYSFNL